MNTEQNYVGRDSFANPNPQTAQTQAPTPSTPDKRLNTIRFAQNAIEEYQDEILDLVDEYLGESRAIPDLSAILQPWIHWADLRDEDNKRQLSTVLSLIAFLDTLRSHHETLIINRDHMAQLQEQEVGHE